MENLLNELTNKLNKKEDEIKNFKNKVTEMEINLHNKDNKIIILEEKLINYENDKEKENEIKKDNENDEKIIYDNIIFEKTKEIQDLTNSNNLLTKEKEELETKILNMKYLVSEISERMEIEADKQKKINEEISVIKER
jgi:hypothetical protein